MTKKDPKDVLKHVISSVEGIPADEIKFNDLRKRTKNKKVEKDKNLNPDKLSSVSNQEGLTLINNGVDFCGYGEIGSSRKRKLVSEKNSLEEWGPFDFFMFAQKLYVDKYNRTWDLNAGGCSPEINKIRDKIYEIFGFCCNLIMKDYIVFFFENYLDSFVKENGDFYFSQMGNKNILLSFFEQYNFHERYSSYMMQNKKVRKDMILREEDIEKSFAIGDMTLVCNYGIVISLNWLLRVKKMDKKQAIILVIKACRDIYDKKRMDVVIKSTEFYSPYPDDLVFKSPQAIINKVDSSILVNVSFEHNDKMRFLVKGK